jgi:hypothetical protein
MPRAEPRGRREEGKKSRVKNAGARVTEILVLPHFLPQIFCLPPSSDHERSALSRQIEATDREIAALVYELYGLSDEESRIVEEATVR